MARRKTTTRRRKTAARKTTTRRRAPAARRRTTTRRKSTTRRRKSPARRRVTRRKSTTRRRKSPARRRVTRRKSTTRRRKSPARRRKTTRRKSTTRRRKSPARRRKTTRRKSTTRRRKSPARRRVTRRRAPAKRRRTARRRSVSRRRTARRRMKVPALGGFTKYVKKHLDTSAIAMVLGGLALPTIAQNVFRELNKRINFSSVPLMDSVLMNPFGQAAIGVAVSAALTYGLASAGVMKESTALGMNMIALGVFAATAIARQFPTAGNYLPYNASIDGMHSMAGYRGGYLGYLGNVDAPMEQLPAPVETQLFGSSPSFNVF